MVDSATRRAWAEHLGVDTGSIDPDALRRELASGTIPGALAEAAAHSDGTIAVGSERLTYVQLHERVTRTASSLASHGIGSGDRVVISAPTSMPFIVAYLAVLHLGATVVLANPTYTQSELDGLIERSSARLLVTDAPPSTPTAVAALADLQTFTQPPHPGADIASDELALLAYTSGTTGTPKGVPLTHGAVLASIRGAMLAWRWSADDVLVHALPMFHQHGLSALHASLAAGSSLSVLTSFDPHELLATIEHERASVMFAVPSIHQRLADLDSPELRALRRLRLITSGSSPLSPELAERLHTRAGIRPLERYGLTESGLDVSNMYGDPVTGSVGRPLPGVEVALCSPLGEFVGEGEIVLRGPQVFRGYLDDEGATSAAFWPGGWFRTGDLGRWDDDGRLTITGRLKELIITGGMNVAPREVEIVVEAHPGVEEAAVAGVPSDRWGEEVTAWVVAKPGLDLDPASLVEHCRTRLAAYKCPKRVIVVDALPRNSMGKLVRAELVTS